MEIKKSLREFLLTWKKFIIIMAIIPFVVILGMIATIIWMPYSLGKIWLIMCEIVLGILTPIVATILGLIDTYKYPKNPKTTKIQPLSNEEYQRYLKESQESERYEP